MEGKIFVHIGLPKTATTSLQADLFPHLSDEGIQYAGVFQPRFDRPQTKFFVDFYNSFTSSNNTNQLRDILNHHLNTGESIILSEEMITVSNYPATWPVKLRNLSEILEGMNYRLIVTVREPASGMFSYYIEQYAIFMQTRKSFLDAAMFDESMHIFHYKKLFEVLFRYFEKDRIFSFRFEDIIRTHGEEITKLICLDGSEKHNITLENLNKKDQRGEFVYAKKNLPEPTIVPIPSEEDMAYLRAFLCDETKALKDHFGIGYD